MGTPWPWLSGRRSWQWCAVMEQLCGTLCRCSLGGTVNHSKMVLFNISLNIFSIFNVSNSWGCKANHCQDPLEISDIEDIKDNIGKFNNIMNIPLKAGTTTEEYLNAYERVLHKLRDFKPEFILFSAGFDAHINDPLAQFKLKSEDFYVITKRTLDISKSFCNGNVVSILEGGYDLNALQESTQRHVDALIEFN